MIESSYFNIIDGISENKVNDWLKYIPNYTSIYTSRVFNDILEQEEEEKEEKEEVSIGNDIWFNIIQYLPTSYLNDSLLGRSKRIRFIREYASNSVELPIHVDEIEDIYPLNKFKNIQITAQLTILIYLNHDFIGGKTRFYFSSNKQDYREVIPHTGRIVIFDRNIKHSAQPIHHSSTTDKFLIKLCCLYGKEKEFPPQFILDLSDFKTKILNLLTQFENCTNDSNKKEIAQNICFTLSQSKINTQSIMLQKSEIDRTSILDRTFFVVCCLFQSNQRNNRILAHQTIALFPRQQFIESGLSLLLGETMLRDSMDQDIAISYYGIKGSFLYLSESDLWSSYLEKWINSNSNIILQACLIGLIDITYRSHYGWNHSDDSNEVPSNKISTNQIHKVWDSIQPYIPILLSLIERNYHNFQEEDIEGKIEIEIESVKEKNIITELVIRLLELQPLVKIELEL